MITKYAQREVSKQLVYNNNTQRGWLNLWHHGTQQICLHFFIFYFNNRGIRPACVYLDQFNKIPASSHQQKVLGNFVHQGCSSCDLKLRLHGAQPTLLTTSHTLECQTCLYLVVQFQRYLQVSIFQPTLHVIKFVCRHICLIFCMPKPSNALVLMQDFG